MADVICGLLLVGLGGALGVMATALVAARPDPDANPYAGWLGRECWVRPAQRPSRWTHCVVVAVSWKGAVAVRDWDRMDGDGGRWIKKQNVGWRVRFTDPSDAGAPGDGA